MKNKNFDRKSNRAAIISGTVFGFLASWLFLTYLVEPTLSTNNLGNPEAYDLIGRALSEIEKIDPNVEKTVYSGIHGMFRTLDPYTQFLEADIFEYMQDQQEGSFYGIGISFDIRNGQLLVVSAIEDSPAWKLGIQPGDVIAEIEGVSTAGITNADVLKKLRGEKGSRVSITITREGRLEPMTLTITRDKIALNSVRGGFFVDPGIGYARITEFSKTTGSELQDTISNMLITEKRLKGLILDLRFNGGGLLSAADDVCSMFLHKNDLIVSTKGRFSETVTELRVKDEGEFTDVPLIVLVNEGSASASEIVAGAIQDHDHGLVIGSVTHGKGLVGSQFPTRFNTAVQITTAQYYTPSNRFIQKPYDLPHRRLPEAKLKADDANEDLSNVYYTSKGRKVFGGGGITPDVIIEDEKLSSNILILESAGTFFDFAIHSVEKYKPITEKFKVTDEIYRSFLSFCENKPFTLDQTTLKNDEPYIKNAILRDLFSVGVNYDKGDEIRVKSLIQVQEAIKLFPQVQTILSKENGQATSQTTGLSAVVK